MKRLTALDIRVYDYVQEYSKVTKRFSMPMYVDSIFGEETVYLTFSGNEADPWEENTEDLYAIEVDEDTLRQFGFEKYGQAYILRYDGYSITVRFPGDRPIQVIITAGMSFWKLSTGCKYVHDIQHFFYDQTKKALKLDWIGDSRLQRAATDEMGKV